MLLYHLKSDILEAKYILLADQQSILRLEIKHRLILKCAFLPIYQYNTYIHENKPVSLLHYQ